MSKVNLSLLFAGVLLTLGACHGYTTRNGAVVYKTWDEGHGTRLWPIEGVDGATFVNLNDRYAKDRNSAYFRYSRLPLADPSTFTAISEEYAKDDRHVYFERDIIKGADPATFRVLPGSFGRDKHDVYALSIPMKVCDLASFRMLEHGWKVDSRCVYWGSRKIPGADPGSLVVLSGTYAKDARHVYYGVLGRPIEGADTATFKLWNGVCQVCGLDKNGCYADDRAVACSEIE